MKNVLSSIAGAFVLLFAFTGCQTTSTPGSASRASMMAEIANEPPGNYYIGRRYYKTEYKFWGYVRKPGQPWSTAQMVVFNEQQRLAPDREAGVLGSDNGVEYRLIGHFSGDKVYEPASNGIYPEFVLTGYEVRSKTPGPIFANLAAALDPVRRVIATPY